MTGRVGTPVVISDIVRKSVCKITIDEASATGFLVIIQPNAVDKLFGLLTNNHVLSPSNVLDNDSCHLQCQCLQPCSEPIKFDLSKRGYFYSSDKLFMDATFIQLPPDMIHDFDNAGAVWLSIDYNDAKAGDKVFIIQHSAEQSKGTMCTSHGVVEGLDPVKTDDKGNSYTVFKHSVTTEKGSSGSPVVTEEGRLIGLYRRSNMGNTNGATNARCIIKALIKHYSKKGKPFGSFSGFPHGSSDEVSIASKPTAGCHGSSSNNGQTNSLEKEIEGIQC